MNQVSPKKQTGFSEKKFLGEIEALIDNDKGERALDRFLAMLPDLATTRMHRRVKLNHLHFAGRMIQDNTSAKHGYEKVSKKFALVERRIQGHDLPKGGTFLDFGCGEYDPLALSVIYYINGMDRNIACDLREPRSPRYSAVSMYDILANITMFPEKYRRPDTDREQFAERLASLNAGPFFNGDFEGGLATLSGKIDYRIENLLDLDVDDETLSLAISFAVLEHVTDVKKIYRWLFEKTRPGGLQFHFVDMADHRSYRGTSEFDPWTFLTEQEAAANHNRLRAHEHTKAFRDAGFEILEIEPIRKKIPPATRERLISPWKDLPSNEIETIRARFLLRREN